MNSRACLLLPLFAALAAPSLSASNFSFKGVFTADDQVQLFQFTVANPTNVVFRTFSYGGGTNSAGNSIASGGFDPAIFLFQPDGTEVGSDDDDTGFNPATHTCDHVTPGPAGCLDSWYTNNIGGAGVYTLALVLSGNTSNGGLSDGFAETDPNFSCAGFVPTNNFCQSSTGTPLTGNWALDIRSVDSASQVGASTTPEPYTWALAGAGLCLVARTRRRRA